MPIMRMLKSEEGQVLPIVALLLVVFIGLLGLAIDVGRLYVAKTELSRAADSAALAGVIELPDIVAAQNRATAYLTENVPDATASFPATSQDYQIRVKASRTVDMTFMSIFGFDQVDLDATAAAGFGRVPIDAVMAIDSTGSMGDSPCNGAMNNAGCPIKEAKDAAAVFAQILLGNAQVTGDTQVGMNAYRGCYNPPVTTSSCVPDAWTIGLSSNEASVVSRIGNINATGGSGTNVCLGLWKANQIAFGAGSHTEANTRRFVVLLSDGDNNYNSNSFGNGMPPDECRPNNPSTGSGGASCGNPVSQEQTLDVKTLALADAMRSQGIEVYVVGFGVCGGTSSAACNRSMVGGSANDNSADRNLLKCLASSASGTNDHYIEVPSASDLPEIFGQIARRIAFRLIE
jgi:hypothetical protein